MNVVDCSGLTKTFGRTTAVNNLEVFSYAPKSPNRLTLDNPPDIRLQGNQLEIIQPERIHLEAVRCYHDFTMAQFTGMGYSMEKMGFYWVGFIFWLLIGIALFLFIYGLWKKSWKALLISGMAFLLPMLYFSGSESWFRLLALVPLIPFVLAYYTKERA